MKNISYLIKDIAKKFKIEIVLVFISSLIITVSIIIFFSNNINNINQEEIIPQVKKTKSNTNVKQTLYIDVSGAVKNPKVYKFEYKARLNDAIIASGGISEYADKNYFARNFNLARLLQDEEKIYIPTYYEINQKIFTETKKEITEITNINEESIKDEKKININISSLQELDTLPSIGNITAQKIIDNRPYSSIEELSSKDVVGKSTYAKIKELITAN